MEGGLNKRKQNLVIRRVQNRVQNSILGYVVPISCPIS